MGVGVGVGDSAIATTATPAKSPVLPGTTHGHVIPTLSVVDELVRCVQRQQPLLVEEQPVGGPG